MTALSKTERQERLLAKLASKPADADLSTAEAAILLDVSTKTLGRWRNAKGAGPDYREKIRLPGSSASNQHIKYSRAALDEFRRRTMSAGGRMSFASSFGPLDLWSRNAAGQLTGNAFDVLHDAELLAALTDDELFVLTLAEALQEPWVSAAAMKPHHAAFVALLDGLRQDADGSFNRATLDDAVPDARALSAPDGGAGRL